ncbi:hypothetical protein [Spirosoma fluviale]|uniref:Uncharacterized protein n=1 Tax=Spirosoma fluviale TaxID=1597977 RepID=A0A286F6A0_9BACT|nr:hypothetical protein [Spirosoma fluviale]SOD78730.1 hypothetical protein SAMN06269250_0612 [Spirosoma fluviale]
MRKELNEVLVDFQNKLSELKTASDLIGQAKDAAISSSTLAQQMQIGYNQLFSDIQVEVHSIRKIKDVAAENLVEAGIRVEEIANRNFSKIDQDLRDGFALITDKIAHLIDEEVRALNDFNQKVDNVLQKIQDSIAINIGGIKNELADGRKQYSADTRSMESILLGNLQARLDDLGQKNNDSLNSINSVIEKNILNIKEELSLGLRILNNKLEALSTIVQQIQDNNRQFYADLERLLLITLNDNKEEIKNIVNEVRENQTEFELRLRIKLDENKAEVKQQVEYGNDQIRNVIYQQADLAKQELQSYFDQQFNLNTKHQQKIEVTLWITGGLLGALVSAVLIKLW